MYNFKKFILFLLLFCTTTCFAQTTKPKPSFSINGVNIKQLLTKRVNNDYNTGIAIAVITAKDYHYYFFGKLSKTPDAPNVNKNTLFALGSLTRVFNSALVSQLAIEKKIVLNDTIKNYLSPALHPGLAVKNAAILNQWLTKQTKLSYKKILQTKILTPLQLNNTVYTLSPEQKSNVAQGYNAAEKPVSVSALTELNTTEGLYSSAGDLAKFVAANMGVWKTPLYTALQIAQQLNWQIDSKHHLFWQGGETNGFSSFIGFDTKQKLGVVVLTNADNSLYTNNLAMHILYPKLKLLPIYRSKSISQNLLKTYSGYYTVKQHTCIKISATKNALIVNVMPERNNEAFTIYPMNHKTFFSKTDNAIFHFIQDKQGNILGVELNQQGQKSTAFKLTVNHCPAI